MSVRYTARANHLAISNGVRLRLAHRVAQVCHAGARDHRRIAKDDRRAGEVVVESHFGAEQNRRDVDVDFDRTVKLRGANAG